MADLASLLAGGNIPYIMSMFNNSYPFNAGNPEGGFGDTNAWDYFGSILSNNWGYIPTIYGGNGDGGPPIGGSDGAAGPTYTNNLPTITAPPSGAQGTGTGLTTINNTWPSSTSGLATLSNPRGTNTPGNITSTANPFGQGVNAPPAAGGPTQSSNPLGLSALLAGMGRGPMLGPQVPDPNALPGMLRNQVQAQGQSQPGAQGSTPSINPNGLMNLQGFLRSLLGQGTQY